MLKPLSWRSALLGALAALVLLLLIALLVVLTGAYNVAATDRHETVVGWALDTTMENSVQSRAENLDEPVNFTPAMIAAGAGEYKAMCEHCHGGVGARAAEWSMGMVPNPPALARVADQWELGEVFWIVRHGIKMTGMPAFGDTHDPETMWNIAAFVKALPQMSAEQYAAFEAAGGHHGGGGSAQGAGGGPAKPEDGTRSR